MSDSSEQANGLPADGRGPAAGTSPPATARDGAPERPDAGAPRGYAGPAGRTSAPDAAGSWQLQLPLRPGGLPLRPLGMGEIFNGAITSMRQAPGAALGSATALSAGLAVVSAILTLALNRTLSGGTTATWTEATGLVLGVGVSTALASVLAVVVGRNLLGWPTRAAEAWTVLRPRVAALLGLSVLLLLIYCALWIPAAALIAVAIATGQPLVIVAGSLLGLTDPRSPRSSLWAVLSLAAPALLLERLSPAAAIRRAWRLGFSSFWRVLGIQVLAGAIFLVVAYLLVLPFAGADLALIGLAPTGPSVLSVALAAVGTVISGTVARPFLAGTAALVYCDVRMRREGLDLALRSSQFATAGAVLTGHGLTRLRPRATAAGHGPPGYRSQGQGSQGQDADRPGGHRNGSSRRQRAWHQPGAGQATGAA